MVASGEENNVEIAEGQEKTGAKIDGVAGAVTHAEMQIDCVQLGASETGGGLR